MSSWKIYVEETVSLVGDTLDDAQDLTTELAKSAKSAQELTQAASADDTVSPKLSAIIQEFAKLSSLTQARTSEVITAAETNITTYINGDAEMAGVYVSKAADPSLLPTPPQPSPGPSPVPDIPNGAGNSAPPPTAAPGPTPTPTPGPAPTPSR